MADAEPQVALLDGGTRLHLHHGPIDLLIDADGPSGSRTVAFEAAAARFRTVLDELVAELDVLRQPVWQHSTSVSGPVAVRMIAAVAPLADAGLTPMAAVAGAVADEIGQVMAHAAPLTRWHVNNGGDIALGLTQNQNYRIGLVPDPRTPVPDARLTVGHDDGIGGVATSGWRGRSWSFGIADAVTVVAATAAQADAAATAIANEVDIGEHPAVQRRPADEQDPASDLGRRPVTVAVGPLTGHELETALAGGLAAATTLIDDGVIVGAWLAAGGRIASAWTDGQAAPTALLDRSPEAAQPWA